MIGNAYWQLRLQVQTMIYVWPVDSLSVESGFLQQEQKANSSTINVRKLRSVIERQLLGTQKV